MRFSNEQHEGKLVVSDKTELFISVSESVKLQIPQEVVMTFEAVPDVKLIINRQQVTAVEIYDMLALMSIELHNLMTEEERMKTKRDGGIIGG